MKIISIMSHKGGVGKTALTINLAMQALSEGLMPALFDLDTQASLQFWMDQRQTANSKLANPILIDVAASDIKRGLAMAKDNGCDLAFIDTSPRMDLRAQQIANLSDFILIPMRPSSCDTHAIIDNLSLVDRLKKPACIILNNCPASGTLANEVETTLRQDLEFPVASQFIKFRVAFSRAYDQGLGVMEYAPGSKAAQEIEALWRWLKPYLDIESTKQEAA